MYNLFIYLADLLRVPAILPVTKQEIQTISKLTQEEVEVFHGHYKHFKNIQLITHLLQCHLATLKLYNNNYKRPHRLT